MKPCLRLGLDGNWYPSAGTLELSRYDPEPLCAAIRLIRRRPEQREFARGQKVFINSRNRWTHRYAGACLQDGEPWHLWGLPWRVTDAGAWYVDSPFPNMLGISAPTIPSFWTLELL